MFMSCTKKRKWEMHSVEHNIWVSCTETPRKSDRHTVVWNAHCKTQYVNELHWKTQKMGNAQCRTLYKSAFHWKT